MRGVEARAVSGTQCRILFIASLSGHRGACLCVCVCEYVQWKALRRGSSESLASLSVAASSLFSPLLPTASSLVCFASRSVLSGRVAPVRSLRLLHFRWRKTGVLFKPRFGGRLNTAHNAVQPCSSQLCVQSPVGPVIHQASIVHSRSPLTIYHSQRTCVPTCRLVTSGPYSSYM